MTLRPWLQMGHGEIHIDMLAENLDRELQWGHDLAVMESRDAAQPGSALRPGLQWGHDLAVMESG